MAEKRRLFINQNRLSDEIDSNGELILTSNESHYLSRVMRMRSEDLLEVIDGKGHLWNAKIVRKNTIKLTKGFENFLQMSCEIGVNIIQPLISKRSVVKECNNEKIIRFQKIIHEAVEQSERLWSPELMQALTFPNWINDLPSDAQIGFATTRIQNLHDCVNWLKETPHKVNQVWLVIGPEGGWNKDEEALAFDSGLSGVSMGETILRTSTAAVSACQLMTSWRRLKSSF